MSKLRLQRLCVILLHILYNIVRSQEYMTLMNDDFMNLNDWNNVFNDCISVIINDDLVRLQCNGNNFTEIIEYTSAINTRNYNDIKVTLILETNNVNINDFCGIEYSINNGIDWIFWTGIYGNKRNNLTTINNDISNIPSVLIRILFNGSNTDGYCDVHYIEISGKKTVNSGATQVLTPTTEPNKLNINYYFTGTS